MTELRRRRVDTVVQLTCDVCLLPADDLTQRDDWPAIVIGHDEHGTLTTRSRWGCDNCQEMFR